MGQTLTHGIYLPDEGERNCYSGLAANWQILDTSVGTIAAHTAALAGKAPAVHTHTKSDVTDLFNSANTWTGDNTFSKAVGFTKVNATTLYAQNSRVELGNSGLSGDSYNQISFWDKNSDNLSYLRQTYTTDGTNAFNIFVRNKFLNGVPNTAGTVDYAYFGLTLNADKSKEGILRASFRPYDNNTYDLGSSSYQWNNIYSKGYYYNGVAWGLDKANVWTTYNTFTGNARPIRLRGSNNDIYNVQPQSAVYSQIDFVDKNNETMSYILFQHRADATETHRLCLRQNRITLNAYYSVDLNNLGDFYPEQNNAINLGTSTNKWKSLNGINPGALSLPSGATENINTDNWNFSWGANTVTAPFDGYIAIACFGSALQINDETKAYAMTYAPGSDGYICGLLPVSSGDSIKVLVTRTQTSQYEGYKFIKASGNVS